MDTTRQKKLRGLFVIASDDIFSESHILWPIIQGFKKQLEEMHVVVFTKAKLIRNDQKVHTDDQLTTYHFNRHWLLFNLPYVWATLQFNLKWRGNFRPDFVMSFTDGLPALVGYELAYRNKRQFFMQGSAHLLGQPKDSIRFRITKFLLKHATAVIVPGPQTAALFTELFSIPPAQLLPLEPPFDTATLAHNTDRFDYHVDHAQYNFFITSAVYTPADVTALLAIHRIIAAKYPRAALIVLVDKTMMKHAERSIHGAKAFGVFAYVQDDTLVSYINGSHVYLAIAKEQDLDTAMITALSLRVPVVTRAAGIAPELFNGSQYQSFMVTDGGAASLAQAVIKLIEDQRLRTEYGLNTGLLLAHTTFVSSEEYAVRLQQLISEIVQPSLQPLHPVADLTPIDSDVVS